MQKHELNYAQFVTIRIRTANVIGNVALHCGALYYVTLDSKGSVKPPINTPGAGV